MQDNTSAIKLENNGRNSCTKNSRHIDVRYFFVTDRVKQGEISIQYCPTNKMLADFFTKPLQGTLFQFYRDIIMGDAPVQQLTTGTNEIKEHVETKNFLNEDGLIYVGSTKNIKKEQNEKKVGSVLYKLGTDLKANQEKKTRAGCSDTIKSYSGSSPTYAAIVKNSC